jgi:glycine/D-amino acid oxidase-like deaminating enzyme
MTTYSYWEHACLDSVDWVVVGAGLVGLQSARKIKEMFPAQRVVVLDEHAFGGAASLRNAGFACFGSAGELLDEISRTSEAEALSLYEKRYLGIDRMLKRYGPQNIGFEATGGREIFASQRGQEAEQIIEALPEINHMLRNIQGEQAFEVCATAETKMNVYQRGVLAKAEGGIQTHLLYRSVRVDALSTGVEIYEGLRVLRWEENNSHVDIYLQNNMPIRTNHLLVCTNGFTQKLLPTLPVSPARGQVFVTQTVGKLPFQGIFHADQGYIYFRSLNNRILIGGGRNLDFEGEETFDMNVTTQFEKYLKNYLEEIVLPGSSVAFDFRWSGIMGMNEQRTPIIGWHSSRVCLAVRMGGMGVALSAWVAEEVGRVIQQDKGIKIV